MRACEERALNGKLGQYHWNRYTHGLNFLRKLCAIQRFPPTFTFAQFYWTNVNTPKLAPVDALKTTRNSQLPANIQN